MAIFFPQSQVNVERTDMQDGQGMDREEKNGVVAPADEMDSLTAQVHSDSTENNNVIATVHGSGPYPSVSPAN